MGLVTHLGLLILPGAELETDELKGTYSVLLL